MSAAASSGAAKISIALTRPGVALTLLAVTGSGALVAQQRPVFWSFTLLVLVFLMYGATRSAVVPRGRLALSSLSHLPERLRGEVTETLAALPSGDAQRHLGDIARLADATLAIPDHDFDRRADADLKERVVELVEACCEASRGLGRIERAWPSDAIVPPSHADAIAAARTSCVRQLQDATGALERLTLSVAQRDAQTSRRVSELTADIRQEIGAREQAIAELDRLLA